MRIKKAMAAILSVNTLPHIRCSLKMPAQKITLSSTICYSSVNILRSIILLPVLRKGVGVLLSSLYKKASLAYS